MTDPTDALKTAIVTNERTVTVTMPKERADTWNRLLALKDRAMDHPRDCVIDEFEADMGDCLSVQVKLCNSDSGGGGPWIDAILWDNPPDGIASEEGVLEPCKETVEGEYEFHVNVHVKLVVKAGQ